VIGKHPCDEGVVLAAPAARPCAEDVRPWVLAATILGSSLAFVDGTVVNVALPALQRELGATIADVQWVVEAYALPLSALLLAGGALGDRLGRRRVYASGIVLFAAASAGCGLAGGLRQLVIARAAQGVGAALLVPGSLAIISASFPRQERGRAIGTWSAFSAVATALGPVVGGSLIEHVSWRWAFFVNLPIAVTVLGMLICRVPESRDPEATGRLDWAGAILATVGLGGIVYGLVESSRLGWRDPRLWGSLAGGGGALLAFGVVEARSRFPMVPLALFRSRSFAGANLLTLLLYGALGGLFFFLPLDLIQVHGYSATAAGAAGLPFILILSLLSRWSGGLIDHFGPRTPLVVGPLTAAAGFALFALPETGGRYWSTFLPAMIVLGLGMAVSVAPLTTTVMNAVDVRHAGTASGINNAVSRAAGLLAVALMSVLMLHVFNGEVERRLGAMSLAPDVAAALDAERVKLAAAETPPGVRPADRITIRRAISMAFVTGFREMALVAAALAATGALAAFVMITSSTIPPITVSASSRRGRIRERRYRRATACLPGSPGHPRRSVSPRRSALRTGAHRRPSS
jgi:EmrB/QacA subfamily drug resistance transporter